MKYKKITIANFKGIKEVTIDFTNTRILTLVGLNESGKTTILEAINLFYLLIKGKKLSPLELNEFRPKGIDFTGKIMISGEYEFEKADFERIDKYLVENNKKTKLKYPDIFRYNFYFEYNLHKHTANSNNVIFEIASTTAHEKLSKTNKELWLEILQFVKKELIPEILYYEDFIFEIPDKIEFSLTDGEDEESDEWKLVLNDIIKATNENFTSFREYVVDFWQSDNDTARNRLSAMEKQLDKKITKAWKELFSKHSENQGQRLNFKEIKLLPIPDSDNSISFSFKVKTDSGKEFSINERSKGCKWFFSFLIFTEFRKKRTDNILFLLDEPASNLHSSAQIKILDAIESLSDKSVIAYSTHSHYLINTKWLNGAYIVINEGITDTNLEGALTDTDTKITAEKYYNYISQTKQKFQPLFFQPIFDKLDYKKSQLDIVPNITICEGKFDWVTYKYLSETILNRTTEFNFYPGKGSGNNGDILRLYLSWGCKFLLILDGDKAGNLSKQNYLTNISTLLEDNLFTYSEILKKNIVTEDLFSKSDYKKIIDTAFGLGTYEKVKNDAKNFKSKFNFAINQLYNSDTRVELDSETLTYFENLFDFIKAKKNAS